MSYCGGGGALVDGLSLEPHWLTLHRDGLASVTTTALVVDLTYTLIIGHRAQCGRCCCAESSQLSGD